LFNRAIALERMSLLKPAAEDWQKYLQVDPSGAWSDEARIRLGRILDQLKAHERSLSEPLLSPSQIARRAVEHDPSLVGAVEERIEDYLQIATADWLPNAFPGTPQTTTGDIRQALTLLADVAKDKHKDLWFSEILAGSSSAAFPSAVRDLSSANNASDFAAAATMARSAALRFHASANLAGELRGKLEEVYALQLSNQGDECAGAIREVANSPAITRYTWLAAQLRIEEGICSRLTGNLGGARIRLNEAAQMAHKAGYEGLRLRTIAFLADFDADDGDLRTGWSQVALGLEMFWAGKYPIMRAYNLYASMDQLADADDQWHLQVSVWQQAISIISTDQDKLLRAMAYSRLGTAAFMADLLPEAQAAFDEASTLLNEAPQTAATRNKIIDVAIWLARVEARKAQPKEAVAKLEEIRPELSQLSSRYVVMDFYQALAELHIRQDHFPESEKALL